MASRYRHKYTAFGDAVLRSPEMVGEMLRRAETVKAAAEFDAAHYIDTGDYIESFKADARVKKPASGSARRAVGTVSNDSPHAQLVEFKDGHHTLGRALDAGGL